MPPKDPIFTFGCPIFPIIFAFSVLSEQLNITAVSFSELSEKTLFPSIITLTIFEHFNVISVVFTVPLFIVASFFRRFSDVPEHFKTMLF